MFCKLKVICNQMKIKILFLEFFRFALRVLCAMLFFVREGPTGGRARSPGTGGDKRFQTALRLPDFHRPWK